MVRWLIGHVSFKGMGGSFARPSQPIRIRPEQCWHPCIMKLRKKKAVDEINIPDHFDVPNVNYYPTMSLWLRCALVLSPKHLL